MIKFKRTLGVQNYFKSFNDRSPNCAFVCISSPMESVISLTGTLVKSQIYSDQTFHPSFTLGPFSSFLHQLCFPKRSVVISANERQAVRQLAG